MKQYQQLIYNVLEFGENSDDRTGTGTRSTFNQHLSFDCSRTFPLVTLKSTHFPSIVHELLWFISGKTNTKYLTDNGITIWNEWATEQGDLGPVYGAQWRNANGHFRQKVQEEWVSDGTDQLQNCIDLIKTNPSSRRIIVDCWNTRYLPDEDMSPQDNVSLGNMALSPCHMFFQFYVHNDRRLDVTMYQRSVDSFLGLPFNIASYALLLNMVAQVTGTRPGTLNWIGGDTHIYKNHFEQANILLEREPYPLPTVELNKKISHIDDFTYDDITLNNYVCHPKIRGEISV